MPLDDAHRVTGNGLVRARALGVPFDGTPGANNDITDVPGVLVGYCTLVEGSGPRIRGQGPVRTGVTAILPRGREGLDRAVFAGTFSLNGCGEFTGMAWIEESGFCEGPVMITNTHSCGVVRDAVVRWLIRHKPDAIHDFGLPVVGETYDGELNDIDGFHVRDEHVFAALDGAAGGPIAQGSVGGGTGMVCYDYKGGSGSASRRARVGDLDYSLGVFVQANFGIRRELVIGGLPVGRDMPGGEVRSTPAGSVIAVLATDAPLLPHQLKRLARRISLGLARSGAISHNGSGDLFLAFSTANADAARRDSALLEGAFLANDRMDPLFEASVQATDEAVVDAMVANQDMTGADDLTVLALPHDRLCALLRRHGRLVDR